MNQEQVKLKKPAKVFVKLQGAYEASDFVGSAYTKPQEGMDKTNAVEYLAKSALIQALLVWKPKFAAQAARKDATGTSKLVARKQEALLDKIIQQIGGM
jgi:hypothetical protein